VTWLDGSPIPPLRKNYLGSVHERARRLLGDHCYDILSSSSEADQREEESKNDDEETLRKLRDAFAYAQNVVRDAEDLIARLGMSVDEFPTHAVPVERSGGGGGGGTVSKFRYTMEPTTTQQEPQAPESDTTASDGEDDGIGTGTEDDGDTNRKAY